MSDDGRLDPRYDPRYQRGYDAGRSSTGAGEATPSGEIPADEVVPDRESLVAAPADDDLLPAEWREPADEAPLARRGVNPVAIVLLAVSAAMIAIGVGVIVWLAGLDDQVQLTRTDRLPTLLLDTAPPSLIAAGAVGAVIGLALLLYLPARRADD